MKALFDALEDRLGVVSMWRDFADQRVAGGVHLRHSFAAVIVYLFIQQAVLGVALATYYSPSATDAWASTAYIHDQVAMGWFVRGIHYHTASVMVVVSGLWIVSLTIFAGYRAPREITWWAALAVFALSLGFGLSGNPLPWDQQGYWGIQVELSIAEQSPGGEAIRTLVQGGSDSGNLAILRLYALHLFVLPGAFGGVVWLVMRQLRRHGAPAPVSMTKAEATKSSQRYFPNQMFLDLLAVAVVAGVIVALTQMTHGAELFAPADPTENFQARPEWYFLFLYKLRMFFEGPMEPVATMVIPGAAATFLLAVPFIDAKLGKLGRTIVLGGVGTLVAAVLGLTAYGLSSDAGDEEYQKSLTAAMKQADEARAYAKEGIAPLGGTAVFFNDPQYKVKQLYKEHCQGCHALDGIGGGEGPDFTDYASRAWRSSLIRNPNDPQFFGNTKHEDMDPYPEADLPADQLEAVVEYLVTLSADELLAPDAALAAKGKTLWEDELECNACHEVEQGLEADGPNLLHHGSSAWVARVIRDASQKDLFGESAQMPKFEGKLTDDEVDQLAEFVVGQRQTAEEEPAEE